MPLSKDGLACNNRRREVSVRAPTAVIDSHLQTGSKVSLVIFKLFSESVSFQVPSFFIRPQPCVFLFFRKIGKSGRFVRIGKNTERKILLYLNLLRQRASIKCIIRLSANEKRQINNLIARKTHGS